jgi:TonB-linked SusC/RagA family outer membrane protein
VTQEVAVGNRTQINIALQPAVSKLDEVVVIGYGTVQKSDVTGAISSVKLRDVNETKAVSISEALQGKLAGVNIVTNTGEPGGAITFNIRGMTSITGSNQPLIVIDGQPIESSFGATYAGTGLDGGADIPPADPLAALNTNDIASIEVLKDASSTAIYGSRGANGVVLITTKTGSRGKDRMVYSQRTDVSKLPKQLDMLSSFEYMLMKNEAAVNDGKANVYSDLQLDSISKTLNVNWQDVVYRNAISQDHNLSFSGKDDKYSYLLTANYSDQESILKKAGFAKGGVRLNYERQITPKLKVGLRTFLSLADRKFGLQSNWTGILGSTAVLGALTFNPLQNPFDPETGEFDEDLANSPLLLINRVIDRTSIKTVISNFNVDYKIAKNLSYSLTGGVNQIYSLRNIWYPTGTFIGNSAPGGSATRADNSNSNYLIDNLLTYKNTFAGKHSLNAVGGFSYQNWANNATSVTNLGFPSNTLNYKGMELAQFPGKTYISYNNRALQSVIGRLNYSYDKRYMFTLTGRYDGSTRLAPGNKWQLYPSVGLGWNVSNEKFFEDNVKALSNLKLRASIGVAGNDNVAVGGSQASYGTNYYPFGPTINPTYVLSRFENPNLQWEKTTKYNAGMDLGFLNDRLSFSVDYYKHITTDLLINLSLPGSAGLGSYFTNIGKIMNQGLDVESTYNIKVNKFNIDLGANFSIFNNKVVDLGEGTAIFGRGFFAGGAIVLGQPVTAAIVGNQISNFYGYKTNGIYQNQNEIDSDPALGNDPGRSTIQPGMIKYVDINGDGQITGDDRGIIGNPSPDFTYGFNSNIGYKRFSATLNIFGSHGGQLLNLNRWMVGSNHSNTTYNSFQDSYFGRWHGEGTSNLYPKLTTEAVRLQQRFPDWMVEDASFIRLQNLTLGYDFKLPEDFKVGGLKVFLTGTNLLTLTNYSGYDPNVNSFGQTSLNNGIDLGTLPQSRSYSAGVQVTF